MRWMTSPCRILVVEDDSSLQDVLQAFLTEECGHAVALLDRADGLLQAAAAFDPDVILMDVHLGGQEDGIAALVRLRDYGNVAPVLLMSAQYPGVADDMARYASIVGAQGYIEKPFDLDKLEAALKRCCAISRGEAS